MRAMLFDAVCTVRKITDALSHVFHGHADFCDFAFYAADTLGFRSQR